MDQQKKVLVKTFYGKGFCEKKFLKKLRTSKGDELCDTNNAGDRNYVKHQQNEID